MDISNIKFIKKSYDNQINDVRNILKSLEFTEFNEYIKSLFNEVIHDIEQYTYTSKESRNILTTLFYALTTINENLDDELSY